MLQSQPNNTDFNIYSLAVGVSVLLQLMMTATASATTAAVVVAALFSFLLSVVVVLFFQHIANTAHTHSYWPRKKAENLYNVHTFLVNVNRHKSLMNSTHAYVLHSVRMCFFPLSSLHYFPVSYS